MKRLLARSRRAGTGLACFLLLLQTSGAGAEGAPGVRLSTSDLAEFYFALRAIGPSDTVRAVPPAMRLAAARLHALTEHLPDSLPLRTAQNTVLIAHRRNPKYSRHIDRLLWRRLDATLGILESPNELPGALLEVRSSLVPICGEGADSIRVALQELYGSAYPLYRSTLGRADQIAKRAWLADFDRSYRAHEPSILGRLAESVGIVLSDTLCVRMRLLASGIPAGGVPVPAPDRSFVRVLTLLPPTGAKGVAVALQAYLRGCLAIAPQEGRGRIAVLERRLEERGVSGPSAARAVDSFLCAAVDEAIAPWLPIASAGGDPLETPEMRSREIFRSCLAGTISFDAAVDSVAAIREPASPAEAGADD